VSGTALGGRDAPRLAVALVPKTCDHSKLRSGLPRTDWDRFRRRCYRQAGYGWDICGRRGAHHSLECHEVWEYHEDRALTHRCLVASNVRPTSN
jgi:hypothetical protein